MQIMKSCRSLAAHVGAAIIALSVSAYAPAALAQTPLSAAAQSKIVDTGSKWTSSLSAKGSKLPIIVEFAMPAIPDQPATASEADRDGAHIAAVRSVQEGILARALSVSGPQGISSAQSSDDVNLKLMPFSPQFALQASAQDIERLAADPTVVKIYEDQLAKPYLTQSVPLIGMTNAYAQGATGNGFRVAVLDTGGRRGHEFLSSRITDEACFNTTNAGQNATSRCPGGVSSSTATGSGEDCNNTPIFGCGHGTHVAGTAAGFNTSQSAGEPANGVARDGRILSINVFSQFALSECGPNIPAGTTGCVLSYQSDQIAALNYVNSVRSTLSIASVNMSLGGGSSSSACDATAPQTAIINTLRANNVATVIAAGNSGLDTQVGSPGCIAAAITVGSSTKSDVRSSFSNWGNLIDVVAPGSDINASYTNNGNIGYAFLNGTSMATPHVAGVWAALRSAVPSATVQQIEDALESTGLGIGAGSPSIVKPRVRVDLALAALAPPPSGNDAFANRVTITPPATPSGSRTVAGNNAGYTREAGEPSHLGSASHTTSAWWSFTPATSGPAAFHTGGSTFNTILAVYAGNSVGGLTLVASNDNFGGGQQSQVGFTATAGTQYQVAVIGFNGASGTISLTAVGGGSLPNNDAFASRVTIAPPAATGGVVTVPGNNAGYTREASEPNHLGSAANSTSAWWKFTPNSSGPMGIHTGGSNFNTVLAVYRGNAVSGLTLVAQNDNAGASQQSQVGFNAIAGVEYQIVVAGFNGVSGSISLTTVAGGGPAPVSNDNFANGRVISPPATTSGTVTVGGNNTGYTKELNEPNHHGVAASTTSAWWRFTPNSSGPMAIYTAGSTFDTVLAVYTGSAVNGLNFVASNDDLNGSTLLSQVTFNATAGVTYQIAVVGYNGASGTIQLNTVGGGGAPPVNNDNFANRIVITPPAATGGVVTVAGNNTGYSAEGGEPNHLGSPAHSTSAWWRFTPNSTGPMGIHTGGSNFNTVLAVYTGNAVGGLTLVASNDNAGAGQQSQVGFNAVAGTQYQIVVAGFNASTGTISLTTVGGGGAGGGMSAGNSFDAAAAVSPQPGGPVASGDNLASFSKEAGQPTRTGKSAKSTSGADILATAITATGDGMLHVPAVPGGASSAAFAALNVGATATLQARISSVESGSTSAALPVDLLLCQTSASTGDCLTAPTSAPIQFTATANEQFTFAVFVNYKGALLPLNPAARRVYIHFADGATDVGSASVGVTTDPAPLGRAASLD